MAQNIFMSPADVNQFLNIAQKCLDIEDNWQINNQPWANGKPNKTRNYMSSTGIKPEDIKQVIKELSVKNYCYTRNDSNIRFPNEQVWIFGITKNLIDQPENFYVKLKLRTLATRLLLILSFHPEQPERPEDKLQFPYSNHTN